MRAARYIPLSIIITLAACGSGDRRAPPAKVDPVMAEALEGQLMVDPDLSQQNLRNYAVVAAAPADPALPLPDPR